MKLRRENERLQEDWQACVEACEDYADQYPGVHFHWINDGADASASGEVAFAQSGMPGRCRRDI